MRLPRRIGSPRKVRSCKAGGENIRVASLRAAEKDEIAKSCRVRMQLGVLVRRARKELRGEEEPWRRRRTALALAQHHDPQGGVRGVTFSVTVPSFR